ncbi:hypothetical protein SDC9_57054 [bioreactor metagenome]|uniref:Uncharacterized protein n=1 Tax=bioreactor metagenome TaxID=1076179 RepID=A0A644X3J4_9ZZZZ
MIDERTSPPSDGPLPGSIRAVQLRLALLGRGDGGLVLFLLDLRVILDLPGLIGGLVGGDRLGVGGRHDIARVQFGHCPLHLEAFGARADLHPGAQLGLVEHVDDILVEQPDAARRGGLADRGRIHRAVDPVIGVLAAPVEIERPRAERVVEPAGQAPRQRPVKVGVVAHHVLRRRPGRVFDLARNHRIAGKALARLAHGDAEAHRPAGRDDVVEKPRIGIDDDRARCLGAGVIDPAAAVAVGQVVRIDRGNHPVAIGAGLVFGRHGGTRGHGGRGHRLLRAARKGRNEQHRKDNRMTTQRERQHDSTYS